MDKISNHNLEDRFMKFYSKRAINSLLCFLGCDYEIVEVYSNELVIRSNVYYVDFIGKTVDGEILNVEFQSTKPSKKDPLRFAKYAIVIREEFSLFVNTVIISTPSLDVSDFKFEFNKNSSYDMELYSLKDFNADELFIEIKNKIKNLGELNNEDINILGLLPLMKTEKSIKELLLDCIDFVNNIDLKQDDLAFLKCCQISLVEKFIHDENLRRKLEGELKMRVNLIREWDEYNEKLWSEKGRAEGRIEGRAEGIVEGRVEGIVEGMAEGRIEGRVEGIVEGSKKELDRIINVLLCKDYSLEEISDLIQCDLDYLKNKFNAGK